MSDVHVPKDISRGCFFFFVSYGLIRGHDETVMTWTKARIAGESANVATIGGALRVHRMRYGEGCVSIATLRNRNQPGQL